MPYIITTTERSECWDRRTGATITQATRRAVATLDEAQYALDLAIEEHGGSIDAYPDISKARHGTVGPLPDGTVIEVELVDWSHIWNAVAPLADGLYAEAIDAYNAAQS
jgi:hypothetical protein